MTSTEQLREQIAEVITEAIHELSCNFNEGKDGFDWLPTIDRLTDIFHFHHQQGVKDPLQYRNIYFDDNGVTHPLSALTETKEEK